MKTRSWLNPVSSQTWRDIQRGPSPTTTVNTSRRGGRRTLSSGWRTQRETGESASASKTANKREHNSHLCVPTGACLDGTLTAPTPATSAPTCRTRQPRSLCPGWRPAQAGESEPATSQMSPPTLLSLFQSVLKLFSIMNYPQKNDNKERKKNCQGRVIEKHHRKMMSPVSPSCTEVCPTLGTVIFFSMDL